jgi:hypothetical protein
MRNMSRKRVELGWVCGRREARLERDSSKEGRNT